MALSIQTNIASLQAQLNLNKASQSLAKNQERLSTGLRINSAADDAAGLAISDRMTAQIRGLNQASMNANDGISLAKTAEGALHETTNILQRMRELAVQAANDSNTADDRASIQAEIDQLIQEVDRIAENTNYNTKTLLDGSLTNNVFQVGSNSNETISFGIDGAKASDLGTFGGVSGGQFQVATEGTSVTTDLANVTAGNKLSQLNGGALTLNGIEIGKSLSGDDTVSSTDNAASAIAIAEAINRHADDTGVRAYAEDTTATFEVTTGSISSNNLATGALTLNGVEIESFSTVASLTTNAQNLVDKINAKSSETGIEASWDTTGTSSTATITLNAVDGRNIEIESNSTGAGIGTLKEGTQTVRGDVTLYSSEGFDIGGDSPESIGFSPQSVQVTSALQDVDGTSPTELAAVFDDLQSGDLIINGYDVNVDNMMTAGNTDNTSYVDQAASAQNIAYAINNTDELSSEVEAEAETVANLGYVKAYDAGSDNFTISVNNQTIAVSSNIVAGDKTNTLVAALNTKFADTTSATTAKGLVASINDDGELLITADDGRNIDVQITSGGTATVDFLGNLNLTQENHVAAKGTVTLTATEGNSIESIEGERQALAGIANQNGLISNLDVTTQKGAQNAIDSIDAAISQIDQTKANLGAIQNRFDSTISNLNNVAQNITDARSRIMDADIAKEAAEMTQNNVRQQAAAAVLTQANQNPQLALQLLG